MHRWLPSVTLLIAVFMPIVLVYAYKDDCEKNAKSCFRLLQEENKLSDLLLEYRNPEKLDVFCSKTTAVIKCIAYNEHCLETTEDTAYQIKTNGIRQFYLSICPPGTDITKRYEESAQCFSKVKDEIRLCDYEVRLSDELHGPYDNELCCALLENKYCLTNVTAWQCDESVVSLVDRIWMRFYSHEMHQCQSHLECSDGWDKDSKRHAPESSKWWLRYKHEIYQKKHHHNNASLSKGGIFVMISTCVFLTCLNS